MAATGSYCVSCDLCGSSLEYVHMLLCDDCAAMVSRLVTIGRNIVRASKASKADVQPEDLIRLNRVFVYGDNARRY